jgi:hypothetical protein
VDRLADLVQDRDIGLSAADSVLAVDNRLSSRDRSHQRNFEQRSADAITQRSVILLAQVVLGKKL